VSYPETVDGTKKRFRSFYKTLVEKYFPEPPSAGSTATVNQGPQPSRILVLVTHGVPAHNPFLHMFEADKDLVYLDYGAVTIVEKTGKAQ
jgi:hypothetical protein